MIPDEKRDCSLHALHAVFVGVRELARAHAPSEALERACDHAEVLPMLFLPSGDQSALFRAILRDLVALRAVFGVPLDYFDGRAQ